jgi:long-chain acyl-CoA synthetase
VRRLDQLLIQQCLANDNKIAIVNEMSILKYSELMESAKDLSTRIGANRHVGICFLNPIKFSVAYLAILMSNSVVVLISNRLTPYEFSKVVHKTNCDIILTDKQTILETDFGVSSKRIDDKDWHITDYGFSRVPSEIAVLLQTSGSTSAPKVIMLSHEALIENAEAHNSHLGLSTDNIALIATPVTSSYGHTSQFLSQLLIGGQIVFYSGLFTAKDFYLQVEKYDVNTTGLVATQLRILAKSLLIYRGNTLRTIICAGGPINNSEIQALCKPLPNTEILRAYGLTEAGPRVTCCRPGFGSDFGTSGMPLRNVQINIRDDNGEVCKNGEIGEIYVKSPSTFIGYYLNQVETDKTLIAGWIKTSDYGFLINERLVVLGRKSNKIIVGGFTVFAEELEDFLLTIPGVVDALARGESDELLGQKIIVDCVLEPDCGLTKEDIKETIMKSMSSYKVPSTVNLVDSIERLETGKVRRNYQNQEVL